MRYIVTHERWCIYVKEFISRFDALDESDSNKEEGQLWVGLKRDSDSVLIGCIYRLPDSNELTKKITDSLRKVMEKIDEFKLLITCGDFNFPKISLSAEGSW